MTDKTLREYIDFLLEKGYASEASYYNNEVVRIVSTATGKTYDQVLDMKTKEIIETLIRAKNLLHRVNRETQKFDVELSS